MRVISLVPSLSLTLADLGLNKSQLVGRTDCDRIVVFDGNPRLAGSLTHVEVHDCTATTLIGSIVTRQMNHGLQLDLPVVS